ncbi:hypothetical protein AK830_g3281 [Neonectria ditissima]|uniref:Actin-like ATPase domain-containing protein n=1 Tax=Neonectria ditissima TaxID=78410 RepID=A0A0P7BSI0_9HYPO|nr:hypothetical protein AK830_g3281 [Neonectria ditissima]
MAAASAQPGGNTRRTVFVGIDFGTTFSGLSYAIENVPGPETVLEWDDDYRRKFPSKVADSNGTILCGPMIPQNDQAAEWFKLALLHHDDLDREIRSSPLFTTHESFRCDLDLRADQLVAHLFRYMWTKLLGKLQDSNPKGTNVFFLTVAVPASWPQYAFTTIRKAIDDSGISMHLQEPVTFVPEPEATILGTISEHAILVSKDLSLELLELNLQLGDIVLVCDCGGGTIDLGGYEISVRNPLTMNECTPGACKLNGAVKLDDRFIDLLDKKAQQLRTNRDFKSSQQEHFRRFARTYWELDMKRNFGSKQTRWKFEVPGSWLAKNAKAHSKNYPQLEFTNNADVLEQYVLVAGGFGQNHYLQRIILEKVNQASEATGQQIQTATFFPDISLTAVSRGAAQKCMLRHGSNSSLESSAVRVDGHMTRASYGIQSSSSSHSEAITYKWFGETLSSMRPQLFSLDSSAFRVTEGVDGNAILRLVVYSQKANARVQSFCDVEWKTGVEYGTGAGSGAIQIQLLFDGFTMRIAIFYRGVRQSDEQVTINYINDD